MWLAVPVPDDWDWFWAGEGGRDNLLRSEIEGLHGQASAARSQAARLSSQLAQVQGSMETRLSALAAAFDAYVELGDVREQLAGYPDTSAVRRDAANAFEVLTRGGIPERLPDRTPDYWLTDAMNAVIALAAGHPDRAAEARAVALDRDAELFLVTAAGALGHGAEVADRVPALLVTDGELTAPQRALWSAVLAGRVRRRTARGARTVAAGAGRRGCGLAGLGADHGAGDQPGGDPALGRASGGGLRARRRARSAGVVPAAGEPVPAADLILAQPRPRRRSRPTRGRAPAPHWPP